MSTLDARRRVLIEGRRFSFDADVFGRGAHPGLLIDFADRIGVWQTDDTSTPVTASGQAAGRVIDRSPTGTLVTQATVGSRGIWHSDGYWLGDGGDDYWWTNLLPANDMTLMLVMRPTGVNRTVAGTRNTTGSTRAAGLGVHSSGRLNVPIGDQPLSSEMIIGSVSRLNTWVVATVVAAGLAAMLRENGAQVSSGTAGGSIGLTQPYIIGGFNSAGSSASIYPGRIAAALLVQRSDMSPALLLAAERALSRRYYGSIWP